MRLPWVLIPCLAFAPAACTSGAPATPAAAGKPPGAMPAPVRLVKAARRNAPVVIDAVGAIEAASTVSINARVGGEVLRVHFREGAMVRKGDLLFTLDARPYEAALQDAKARLARDEILSRNAQDELKRTGTLLEQKLIPQDVHDRMKASAAAQEAALAAARAAVTRAELDLGWTLIRAPVDGRTGDILVHAGNVVKANDTQPMVVIRQVRPLMARFAVPEAHLAAIRETSRGGELAVEAVPGGSRAPPSRGVLTFIDSAVNASTGTIALKASFANEDDALWPGQYVNVRLTLAEEKDALLLPVQAVQQGQQGSYVYLVRPDNTVEMRPVRTARYSGDEVVIASGVAEGDTVVLDGHLRLYPGAPVKAVEREAPVSETPAAVATAAQGTAP
ncbi:MAG: Multidrug resistance protein MdtA [Myxococcota bacterium]|nr:Multidrug resistance protein MdtA [Myxococcota bacterium]